MTITSTDPTAVNIYPTNKVLLPTMRITTPLNSNDYAPIQFYFKTSKILTSTWTLKVSSTTLALDTAADILCKVRKFS